MKSSESTLRWAFSALLASITALTVVFLLSFVPNTVDMERIAQEYVFTLADPSNFCVENSEKLQYVFGIIAFFLSFIAYGAVLSRRPPIPDADTMVWMLRPLPLIFCLTASVYLFKANPMYIGALSEDRMLLLFCGGLLVYMVFICLWIYDRLTDRRLVNCLCVIFAACIAGALLYYWRVRTYWGYDSSVDHHVGAYFYPVYQVWCGNTPGIDFHNLYGFYPYLIVPVLRLIGGISDLRFSMLIAVMLVLCLVSFYRFLVYVTKNHLLAMLGSCAAIYVVTFYPANYQFPFYPQYAPQRLFFPAVSLWCMAALDRQIRKTPLINGGKLSLSRPPILLAYGFATVAVFWNVESGLAVLLALSAYLVYCLAWRLSWTDRLFWTGVLAVAGLTAASLLASYGAAVLISFVRTGRFLSLSNALYGIMRFSKDGFYMLPLPLRHPWLLVMGLYLASAALPLTRIRFFRKTDAPHDSMEALSFFAAILGILVFLYYQGRSHDNVFPLVSWPAFLLLALWEARCQRAVSGEKCAVRIMSALSSFVRLCFLVIPILCMTLAFMQPDHMADLRQAHAATKDTGTVGEEVRFVRETLNDDQIRSLDTLGGYKDAVNRALGITDVLPIASPVDWFLYTDVEESLYALAQSEKEYLFVEQSLVGYIAQYCPEIWGSVISRYESYATDPLGFEIFRRVA